MSIARSGVALRQGEAAWPLAALVLAIGAGIALTGSPDFAKNYIKPFGTIFLNLIKWIVCPLVFFSIMSGILSMKDQLKFVISDRTDLIYAERFLEEHPVDTNVIFSPVGGMDLGFLAEEVVSKKLDVRVLPQLHKIIWGDKQGV